MRSNDHKQGLVQTLSPPTVNPSEVTALLKLLKEIRSIEKEHREQKSREEAAREQARKDALAKTNSERAKSKFEELLRVAGLYLFVKHKEKEIELDAEKKKLEMQRLFRPQMISQAIQTDEAKVVDSKAEIAVNSTKEIVAGGEKEKTSLPQPGIVAEPPVNPFANKTDHGIVLSPAPPRATTDQSVGHVHSLAI